MAQLDEKSLFIENVSGANSIAVIVQHLHGNMLSRWTDFLVSDGEKDWRKRDEEFEPILNNLSELKKKWKEGWDCLFKALDDLKEEDLNKIVYIRNQKQRVFDAIQRQIAHYAYHIGQIVYIGKMMLGDHWKSISIPKNESKSYNFRLLSEQENDSPSDRLP